jgi:putative transposase
MSKKIFTNKEISVLSKNKYVKNVSSKSITYTNEFKIHFIAEYSTGKSITDIFNEAELSVDLIGYKRIETASHRWRKKFEERGVIGLDDDRKINSGRPLKKELI